MPLITKFLLAGVVAYIVAWYFGIVAVDMSAFLMVLTIVAGGYWLLDWRYYLPKRRQLAQQFQAAQPDTDLHNEELAQQQREKQAKQVEGLLARPWWLEWTAGIFPVLLLVFVLRTALYEPFYIPSGSMMPTLKVGDFILVDKHHYGIKIPIINRKITSGTPIQRGDIIVFRYPLDRNIDYIKRVVGLPGDKVAYLDKRLYINGELMPAEELGREFDETAGDRKVKLNQRIDAHKFNIYHNPDQPALLGQPSDFLYSEGCDYTDAPYGFSCVVPPGYYLTLGDNRDNSADSRYWGFVPEQDVLGKAVYIWLNFKHLSRRGSLNEAVTN